MINTSKYSPELQRIFSMLKNNSFSWKWGKELFAHFLMKLDDSEFSTIKDFVLECELTDELISLKSVLYKVRAIGSIKQKTSVMRDTPKEIEELFNTIEKNQTSLSQEVNSWQFQEITWFLPQQEERQRTLNFYNRNNQWAYIPHYDLIVFIIRHYIDNNYSSVWNNIRVLERSLPTQNIGWVDSEYYCLDAFRAKAWIFADTIHLTHGTPEKTPGTHSIVWTAIYTDTKKIEDIDSTPVSLLYYSWMWSQMVKKRTWCNWKWFPEDITLQELFDTVIDALQRAEKSILKKAITHKKKIHDILLSR